MNLKQINRRRFNGALVASAATLLVPHADAQTWPSKPISMIVPYTPGGFTDVTARLVDAEAAGAAWPDGRDRQQAGRQQHHRRRPAREVAARRQHVRRRDRRLCGQHHAVPEAAVRPEERSRGGVADRRLAADGRGQQRRAVQECGRAGRLRAQNPGKVSFGSSGNGSAAHLTTELLKSQTAN